MSDIDAKVAVDLGKYKLGWSDKEDYVYKPQRGLSSDIIREMSMMKKEPDWMLDFRLLYSISYLLNIFFEYLYYLQI